MTQKRIGIVADIHENPENLPKLLKQFEVFGGIDFLVGNATMKMMGLGMLRLALIMKYRYTAMAGGNFLIRKRYGMILMMVTLVVLGQREKSIINLKTLLISAFTSMRRMVVQGMEMMMTTISKRTISLKLQYRTYSRQM